jgi:hypothetical protein
MTNARIFKLEAYEQMPLPLLGRIYKLVPGSGKSPIVQADIQSIALTVRRFNQVAGGWGGVTNTEAALNVPVIPAVFNSLQTDSAWSFDMLGYNFAHTIPAAAFPGLGVYSVVYVFTPVNGASFSIFPLALVASALSLQGVFAEG